MSAYKLLNKKIVSIIEKHDGDNTPWWEPYCRTELRCGFSLFILSILTLARGLICAMIVGAVISAVQFVMDVVSEWGVVYGVVAAFAVPSFTFFIWACCTLVYALIDRIGSYMESTRQKH